MAKGYTAYFLRKVRNEIPIDDVITVFLNLEFRMDKEFLRFRCPLCYNQHTATNRKTNLARCFDCEKNFNPIDMVMTVGKCSFVDAVEYLKKRMD